MTETPVIPSIPPELAAIDPHDADALVSTAVKLFGGKLTLACSFGGAGGMVLLDMGLRHKPDLDVFVLDTNVLFRDTYKTIERVEAKYGIKVRRVKTDLTLAMQAEKHGEKLWERDPNLCCHIRKVLPMQNATRGFDAWITAIRRTQSSTRTQTEAVSWDEQFNLWKLCPLALWSEDRVMDYVEANAVPLNPMLFEGYTSIGCEPCTRKPTDADARSGRWAGFGKIECGLHVKKG